MKAKKDNHIKGSIFSMLIRNFILFTLIFLFCSFCVYMLVESRMRGIINEPLYQKLISYQKSLQNDRFYELPVEKMLGKGSMIQVLNEKNDLIYESKKDIAPSSYTKGEIECIPQYNDYRYAQIHDILWKDGPDKKQKLLTITYYNGNVPKKESFLLNQQNKILNSTVSSTMSARTSFTQKELGYITGEYPGNVWIQKYEYHNGIGLSRTLLLILPNISDRDYLHAQNELNALIYLLIAIYIILILLFVFAMNKKFKAPIRLLNRALLNFAEGDREGTIAYSGPIEFVKICNSFNIMSRRLSASEQENKRLTEEKTKMLADISHDLKTPVTVISGYSKALSDNLILAEEKPKYYDIIYKKSLLLGELINKFYEYSKLDHPDFKFQFEKTDICEFLREYLAMKFDELQINQYDLNISIPEERIYILADGMQLRRVFENLISNSVKHTPVGTNLYFTIIKSAEYVTIEYADDGAGIPTEIGNHIFEPFVVADPARNQNGSGLGLSIVEKIIVAHGGSIQIVIPPRKHSIEFRIQLPRLH